MMSAKRWIWVGACFGSWLASACGGSDDPAAAQAGSAGVLVAAGTSGSGVAGAAGALAQGGGSPNGGASPDGGASPNGGASPSGGSSPSGGASAAGASAAGSSGASQGGSSAGGASGGSAGAQNQGGATSGLPAKIVAGYYPNWTESPARIKDVNTRYNVIYLFAAQPVGGAPGTTGAVNWTAPGNGRGAATNLNADIAFARATQKRKIILSVGGAGNGMSFPNRQKSQAFVDSIVSWYGKLGGFDGIDWNTFEGSQAPDTSEMIWISLELKKRYPGFIVSAPPAPWNGIDKTFCKAMVDAGALDYAAPQYYDGPNLATQDYLVKNVAEWVTLLGASKVVVGFGIWNQANYWAIGDAVKAWNAVEAASPTVRGAFDWQIHTDEAQGWPFAEQIGPIVTN